MVAFGQPTGTFEAKGHTFSSTSFEFGTLNGGSIIQLVYGYGQRSQPLMNLDNSLTLSLSLPSLYGVTLCGPLLRGRNNPLCKSDEILPGLIDLMYSESLVWYGDVHPAGLEPRCLS
jgi:hypothetical protein